MNQFVDFLNGWKTRLWAGLLAILGIIVVLDPTWIIDIVGKENQGYVFIAFAIITTVLRQFTTTPAGESDKFDG